MLGRLIFTDKIKVTYHVSIETHQVDSDLLQEIIQFSKEALSEPVIILKTTKPSLSSAHNFALRHSQGDYTLFLQDDFEFKKSMDLEEAVFFLENNSEIEMLRYDWLFNELSDTQFPGYPHIGEIDFNKPWPYSDHPHIRRSNYMEVYGEQDEALDIEFPPGTAESLYHHKIAAKKVRIAAYRDPDILNHVGHISTLDLLPRTKQRIQTQTMTQKVLDSMVKAESLITKLPSALLSLEEMSGVQTRIFLNSLLEFEDIRLLEVGTYHGSTTISAAFGNENSEVQGVDNFSQFSGSLGAFEENCRMFLRKQIPLLPKDFFSLDEKDLPLNHYNCFIYDGDHSFEAHSEALLKAYPYLADEFIFIVDDYNWPGVQKATREGIQKTSSRVQMEIGIQTLGMLKETWWNGYYVGILKKTISNELNLVQ